jgi:hypothetical protein
MARSQPDEQYTPQGEKIPIPKREDFIANVRKVIESEPPPSRMRKSRKPKP